MDHRMHDITAQKVAGLTTIASKIGLEQWLGHGHWEKRDRLLLLEIISWLTLTQISWNYVRTMKFHLLVLYQIARTYHSCWMQRFMDHWGKNGKRFWKDCKLKNYTQITLPKDIFPALLKQLVSAFDTDNLKGGFRSCGIYPFNPDALYSKLPECRFCSRKQAQYIKFSFKFKFKTSQAKHKVHGSGSRKKCLSRRCSWTFAIKEQWKNGWVFAVGEWWNQFFWNGIWELSTWRFLTGSRYQECGLCSRGG